MLRVIYLIVFSIVLLYSPRAILAHEVYVLNQQEISSALSQTSLNPFGAINQNLVQFIFAALITCIGVLAAHFLSGWLTKFPRITKTENNLKKWAPMIIQLTMLGSILSFVYFNALFGPELSLNNIFGDRDAFARALLIFCAFCLVFQKYIRFGILVFILLFVYALVSFPFFSLVYTVYLGIAVALFLYGPHFTFPKNIQSKNLDKEFLIIRIALGFSLLYSAFSAKFLQSQLAIETIMKFELTKFLPFDALFIVLGALIIESLVGLSIIFGYQIRLVACVFTAFLAVSIFFFQESPWPHFVLFGTAFALFFHGYDKYTLGRLISRSKEPVL